MLPFRLLSLTRQKSELEIGSENLDWIGTGVERRKAGNPQRKDSDGCTGTSCSLRHLTSVTEKEKFYNV